MERDNDPPTSQTGYIFTMTDKEMEDFAVKLHQGLLDRIQYPGTDFYAFWLCKEDFTQDELDYLWNLGPNAYPATIIVALTPKQWEDIAKHLPEKYKLYNC